jgi:hypothetical protein
MNILHHTPPTDCLRMTLQPSSPDSPPSSTPPCITPSYPPPCCCNHICCCCCHGPQTGTPHCIPHLPSPPPPPVLSLSVLCLLIAASTAYQGMPAKIPAEALTCTAPDPCTGCRLRGWQYHCPKMVLFEQSPPLVVLLSLDPTVASSMSPSLPLVERSNVVDCNVLYCAQGLLMSITLLP